MAGIVEPIKDVMTRLRTLTPQNQDGLFPNLYVRVWNNQFSQLDEGSIYNFPLPAAFVEVVSPAAYNRIGVGFSQGDLIFKIHIGHEQLDAGDGNFEQDLKIFDLRDSVIRLLSDYAPSSCGHMMLIYESQSFEHKNVYAYDIDFIVGFIDSKGSAYDDGCTDIYITKQPPTGLQINVDIVDQLTTG